MFPKVNPRTLRNEALDILRNAIITGALLPGQHLIENELSEQMAISRSPIREALRSLEEDGLVEAIPNQGCFVKSYNNQEILEIFTLRAALENLAGELLITQNLLVAQDIACLDDYIIRQRQAIEGQDIHALTSLDMDFHEYLCHKSGSKLLLKTWRSLRNRIQVLFYQRFRLQEQVSETVDADHRRILDVLQQGDLEELSRLNKEISTRVALECIAVFQKYEVTQFGLKQLGFSTRR